MSLFDSLSFTSCPLFPSLSFLSWCSWKKFSQAATINAFYNSLENSVCIQKRVTVFLSKDLTWMTSSLWFELRKRRQYYHVMSNHGVLFVLPAFSTFLSSLCDKMQQQIKFPAGILQGIFFDKNRPNYLNYGAIGYIIGHEITHGFDDRGRQFDRDGNNRNWWEPETDLKFQQKAQCIIDQYNNFSVPEDKSLKASLFFYVSSFMSSVVIHWSIFVFTILVSFSPSFPFFGRRASSS